MKRGARHGTRYRLPYPPIGFQQGVSAERATRYPVIHWIFYWLTAHTTPRLYILGAIGLGPSALFLLIEFDTPALLVGFAVAAWMVANLVAGYLLRPRLEIEVTSPWRVECGSHFETSYQVCNRTTRMAREVAVDTLVFSDWLSLRRGRARLEGLPPGATRHLTSGSHALKRGVFQLPALRYDSAFPGGIWRWGHTGKAVRLLYVYPRYTRLEQLDMPLGRLNNKEVSHARELARAALEFHGCREFRDGDALRHVHPRSSARIGIPVVKEFQAEGRSRTAIIIDTHPAAWLDRLRERILRRDRLEAALSLAAAVVDFLSLTERTLELLVAGPAVYRFKSEGRVGYLEEVLDILAAVEPSSGDPLDQLEPILLGEILEIQSLCLILTRWDARRAELVRTLEATGVGMKVILISRPGFETSRLPPGVQCARADEVLRGEVNAL